MRRPSSEQRQQDLRKFAVDAYVSGADAPGIDAILSSQIDDSAKVRGYVDIATGSRQDMIDQLQATRQKAEQEGAALQSARDGLEARHAQLARSLDDAEGAVDEQQSIKSKLDGEVATLVSAEQTRKAEAAQAAAAVAAPRAAPTGGGAACQGCPLPHPPLPHRQPRRGRRPAVGSGAQYAIDAAMSKIGSPYVWAAAGPNSFDCSGLTMWAWAHGGKSLSHYTGSQWASSTHISAGEAQPGDLVFFWGPGDGGDPGHVGLYLGGGTMVHAPHTGSYREDRERELLVGRSRRLRPGLNPPLSPGTAIDVPDGHRPSGLLLALHGYEDDPVGLAALLAPLAADRDWSLLAPTGPVRTARGAAWFPPRTATPVRPSRAPSMPLEALAGRSLRRTTACNRTTTSSCSVGRKERPWRWRSRCVSDPAVRPAVVIALAAWLPNEPGITWDFAAAAHDGLRLLLVHGRDDEVVAVEQGRSAYRVLERSGVDVTWIEIDAGHDLDVLLTAVPGWLEG